MNKLESMFPNARIPYGTWGSSYFPSWQTSALAEVNIGQFAGEAMAAILGKKKVRKNELDLLIIGSTVPYHWKFWTAPMVASCMGQRVPGYHMENACGTGLITVLAAGADVNTKTNDVVGVLTFDRTSDSPAGVFPEKRAYRRTEVISDVWDNFGFDPSTGKSMLASAGAASRKYKLDRAEVDELTYARYEGYFAAKESGLFKDAMFEFDILGVSGNKLGTVDGDFGIRKISLNALKQMRELDTCVTGGGQTHAADGMATLLVSSPEKVKELSPRPEIDIQFIAKTELRTLPGLMPEAPALAVKKLIERTGLKLDDVAVIKSHNPFAINDAIFTKVTGHHWSNINKTGCSLVWGHPQAPTLTRTLIEALEEGVKIGGGYVLIMGCAAGDVGVAALFKIN